MSGATMIWQKEKYSGCYDPARRTRIFTFSIQQRRNAELLLRDVEGMVEGLHVGGDRYLLPAEQVRPGRGKL